MQMTRQDRARLETRSAILKALAHPVRLFIVETLAEAPRCVRDLTEMVGLDISTVSKHLSILKNAGLVRDLKQGRQVVYHLRVRCALNFLDCVETVLRQQAEERLAAVR
jgi:DNA-binding transcriptional ArsR family regulator